MGDTALIAAVKAMLEADTLGASLLEHDLPELAHAILDQPGPSLPANRFGHYKLLKALGEGGMGVVYLAEHEATGGEVAIKTLNNGWLSPARRQRFGRAEDACQAEPSVDRSHL